MSYVNEKPFQFWVAFAGLVIIFFWLFNPILAPFIVGFAVAYLLNPIIKKLEAKKIPRWLSSLAILSVFFLTLLIGLLVAIPILIREMIDFIKLLPNAIDWLQNWLNTTLPMVQIPTSLNDIADIDKEMLSEKAGSVFAFSKNILGNIFQGGMAIIGFISFIVLMPIVAFYLMIDWSRVVGKIDSMLPRRNEKKIHKILNDIDRSLAGFIRGQLTVCVLLGGFYAIALSAMGLQYGFFVGVASGVLTIIPYIGSLFGLVASVGLAYYQFGGWEYPLIAFAIFMVGQLVEGNYLTPKLVGDSVGLHPLWVIFALMAGGMLLGLLGMMIAVPVAAIIAVFIRHSIDSYKGSAYYKGK